MRLGIKLPTDDPRSSVSDVTAFAARAEALGYDSLWVSDHVVMPEVIASDYPFAADRRATWSTTTPWFDVVVLLSVAAAATRRIALGTAVLVAPLRQPVVFATQVASLDRLSGGRVRLGIGPGWLAEEFAVVGLPFERRGRITDEWMEVVRSCFSGRPAAHEGKFFTVPGGLVVEPTPASAVPFIVGGTSAAALRRATRLGDGWMAHDALGQLDLRVLAEQIAGARAERHIPVTLRLVRTAEGSAEVVELIPTLIDLGVDELIVDADTRSDSAAAEQFAALSAATTERTMQHAAGE